MDGAAREMTLEEYCGKLNRFHRAKVEFEKFIAEIADLRGRVAAAERKLVEYKKAEESLRFQTGEKDLSLIRLLVDVCLDRVELNTARALVGKKDIQINQLRTDLDTANRRIAELKNRLSGYPCCGAQMQNNTATHAEYCPWSRLIYAPKG
jgi:capsule polysaccharide export protein KpsE/RkpR